MKDRNTLTNFVEKQEILDNIRNSIKKLFLYENEMNDSEYVTRLTEKTYEVMEHMDGVYKDLTETEGVILTAEEFSSTPEKIANDVVEIMLLATIAKQNLLIDDLKKQ